MKILKAKNIVSLFILLLGLYVIRASLSMCIWHHSVPEEGFLPLVLGSCLALLASLLLIDGLVKHGEKETVGDTNVDRNKKTVDQYSDTNVDRIKVIYYTAILLFYTFTFNLLGFYLGGMISLVITMRLIEKQNLKTAFLVAIGSEFLCFVIFTYLLDISLPMGPLDKWKYMFAR